MSKKLVCPQCQCELEFSLFTSGISQEIRCTSCGASLNWDAGRKAVNLGEGSARSRPESTNLEGMQSTSLIGVKTAIDPKAQEAKAADVLAKAKSRDASAGEVNRVTPSGTPPRGSGGPPDPKNSLIGRTIGGCEILEWIGRGGMGAVYKARQISLDRMVAFKVIGENMEKDESLLRRFEREAKTIARFNSSRIVGVHEVGFDDGIHFIFMEFVPGGDLKSMTRKLGRFEPDEGLRYVRQAAEGLLAAEKQKIIHRDLKPENLMLDANGEIKITDFGLAKTLQADLTLTQMGDYLGTPIYMSPEQAQGITLDHRSDLYSLGATFFFVITGAPPYEGATIYEILRKKAEYDFLDPRSALEEGQVPDGICKIIRRMTALQPKDRYASFADLIEDIDRYFQGKAPRAPGQRLRVLTLAAASAALLLGGAFGFWFLQLRVVLTAVEPLFSRPEGGVNFTLRGSNFPSARSEVSLRFGDKPVVQFEIKGSKKIEGTVPPGTLGRVDVTVSSTWSSAKLEKAFEYREIKKQSPPSLTSLEPPSISSLEGGLTFTLHGKDFPDTTDGVTIYFGENKVEEFRIRDSSTIVGQIPQAKTWGVVKINLMTPDGSARIDSGFAYLQPEFPTRVISEDEVKKSIERLRANMKDCEKIEGVFSDALTLRQKIPPDAYLPQREFLEKVLDDLRAFTSARERIMGAPPLISAVPDDDLAQSWRGLKERKEWLEKIFSTQSTVKEIGDCLESEARKRLNELEQRARDVCAAYLKGTEQTRDAFTQWQPAAAEEFPSRVQELKTGKQKLVEIFPGSRERMDAAVPTAKLAEFDQAIVRRAGVEKTQKDLLGLLTKAEGQFSAIDQMESWTGDLGKSARSSLELIQKGVEGVEKDEPRASLAEQKRRLEGLAGQVKKWNDHAGLYEKAGASLVGRSLEDPVFETLAKDGIADRAAERLLRGRIALAEAFRLLEEKLDAGGAVASLGAAKEELKGLEGAGPWIDGCLARVKKLEGLLPGMAPVPAGKVKIPDEAAPQEVAAFFIDRFEVSVDDYRRFLDTFRGKSPEELQGSFPDLKGLDAASFRECFSEPRYLSEVPPPNGNWPIETVTYHQARAYSLWLGKDLFSRAEWWLAARGDLEKGQHDFPCLLQQLKRSGDYPDPVYVGCQSVGFSSRTPVYHLSGNVAEWVKALPGAETAQLIGGSYKDREKREKFNGEVPDNRELRRSLRGYGFRGVVRPREFFRDLLPKR